MDTPPGAGSGACLAEGHQFWAGLKVIANFGDPALR